MLPMWLHVLAATIWIGSQVMMFAVVVPALRAAEPSARQVVLAGVTRRFGFLGLGSLVVLAATGLDNLARYAPPDMFEYRYGYILAVKLAMLGGVLVLTALHATWLGPRMLALQERAMQDSAAALQMQALRRRSVSVTVLTLVLSLAILFCAVLLRSSYAFG